MNTLFLLLVLPSVWASISLLEGDIVEFDPLYLIEYVRLAREGFNQQDLCIFTNWLKAAMTLGPGPKRKRVLFDLRRMLDCGHPQRFVLNQMLDLCEPDALSRSFTWSVLIQDRAQLQKLRMYPNGLLTDRSIHHRILHLLSYTRLAKALNSHQIIMHAFLELSVLLELYKCIPDRMGVHISIEQAIRTIFK